MKVLMFGWEFPPHISGGLGTACYGLTKGLSSFDDIELLFVVPKAHGDESHKVAQLIGANEIVENKNLQSEKKQKVITEWKKKLDETEKSSTLDVLNEITYIEVDSAISPYLTPEQYEMKRKERIAFEKKIKEKVERIETEQHAIDEGIKHIQFTGKYGTNLLDEVANYARVASVIAKQNTFDLIHAHDWLTYPAGIAAKEATGKPLVIHVHATEFDRSGENVDQRVYDIERWGMHAADKIIAVSKLTRNTVIERYGVHPDKVLTVYNAVEPPAQAYRAKYKKTVDEKIVTFLGRITFQKGPEYFVEAAHKVLQKKKNVRFVMAGSGDLFNRMVRRAAQLGITDKFHFTGFLKGEEVDRMFALSDVYVMPSVSEPFGISPLEAMRSNVPVIISKQSGVSEILEHAIKVDFWDVDAIADSIYGILSYEALSKMFIRYGKEEVDKLKWENAAYHVKSVYESVI